MSTYTPGPYSVVNGRLMRDCPTARIEVFHSEAAHLLNDLLAALREIETRWNHPTVPGTQDTHYMGNVARLAIAAATGGAA